MKKNIRSRLWYVLNAKEIIITTFKRLDFTARSLSNTFITTSTLTTSIDKFTSHKLK